MIRVCVATIARGILVSLALASDGAPAEALYMCRADAPASGAAALMRMLACSNAWLQGSTHLVGAGAAAMLVRDPADDARICDLRLVTSGIGLRFRRARVRAACSAGRRYPAADSLAARCDR